MATPAPLRIETLNELFQREGEILRRLGATRHGANLFVTHPLRALADANVVLSDVARRELLRWEPSLETLSSAAYDALKNTQADKLNIRFHLKGLFRRPQ